MYSKSSACIPSNNVLGHCVAQHLYHVSHFEWKTCDMQHLYHNSSKQRKNVTGHPDVKFWPPTIAFYPTIAVIGSGKFLTKKHVFPLQG